MEELFERIRQYVDGHHDEMLALWEEMVNTESGSRQLEGVAAMDDILRRELESVGAKVRVLPVENAGGVLVAEWNSGSPKAPCCSSAMWTPCSRRGQPRTTPSASMSRAGPTAPACWT
ncbi:MAG: hypothetical protein ACLRNQ_10320 [Flavonifractor plautii]